MNTNPSYEDPSKYPADTEKASELLDRTLGNKMVNIVDTHFPKGKCQERGQAAVVMAETLLLFIEELKSFRSVSDIREAVPEKIVLGDPVIAARNKDFTDGFNQAISEILEGLNIGDSSETN